MIKLFVLDDHTIFREGVSHILNLSNQFEVVAQSDNEKALWSFLENSMCDVLLLDISLRNKNGLDILKKISEQYPLLKVLILTMHDEVQYGMRAFRAGAKGFMNKACNSTELYEAVEIIAKGQVFINEAMSHLIANDLSQNDSSREGTAILSDREYEVFQLLGKGNRIADISEIPHLSVKTVSTYRTRILEKMNLNSTAEIIKYYCELEIA